MYQILIFGLFTKSSKNGDKKMDQRIELIRQDLAEGGIRYTSAARECVMLIEYAFQELFHRDLTKLPPEDRIKAQEAEQQMGKGRKGIKDFTMGELIGLYRKSGFLEAWMRVCGLEADSIEVINLNELNKFRNELIHKNRQTTATDAHFLFSCLCLICEYFETGTFRRSGKTLKHAVHEKRFSKGITPRICTGALAGGFRELYLRDLTSLQDPDRFAVLKKESEITENRTDAQKGIEFFSDKEVIRLFAQSDFIRKWIACTQNESAAILFIHPEKLCLLADKLIEKGDRADFCDVRFLFDCTLLILNTFRVTKPAVFEKEIRKSTRKKPVRQHIIKKQYVYLLTAFFLLLCLLLYFWYTDHGDSDIPFPAEQEAAVFFQASAKYLAAQEPPALCDENNLPPGFSKNRDILYQGQLLLDMQGRIIGNMYFSHKNAKDTIMLTADGSVRKTEGPVPPQEKVSLFDLSAKTAAADFYRAMEKPRFFPVWTDVFSEKPVICDKAHPPSAFTPHPDIQMSGQFQRDEQGNLSGEMRFSHKKSATVFLLNSKGQVEKGKTGNWSEPRTGMKFVWLPGGCYEMGCRPEAAECFPCETPVHTVCVDGFRMGECEVSQGQWGRIMLENPSLFQKGDSWPLENVSWDEAKTFADVLNKKSKLPGRFRLPTEAEWEYACRFYGGSTVSTTANASHPTGQHGDLLFEMKDNVLEWCEDGFHPEAYRRHKRNNPEYTGTDSDLRVVRGRSWSSPYPPCTHRFRYKRDESSGEVGFRLVWEFQTSVN